MTSQISTLVPRASIVRPRRSRTNRKQLVGFAFVAPAILLVVAFFVVPLVMTAWMSLHNWPLLEQTKIIGLENYLSLFIDDRFWSSMLFTVYYTAVITVVIFAFAFPLALFVERPDRLAGFYRTVYFLPVVVGVGSASLGPS